MGSADFWCTRTYSPRGITPISGYVAIFLEDGGALRVEPVVAIAAALCTYTEHRNVGGSYTDTYEDIVAVGFDRNGFTVLAEFDNYCGVCPAGSSWPVVLDHAIGQHLKSDQYEAVEAWVRAQP